MAKGGVPLVPIIVAAVLILVGGLAFYTSVAHSYTYRNSVSLDAADGVVWTVWVPRGPRAMDVEASEGNVTLVGVVETPYGTYSNLSGTGSARVQWFTGWTTYYLGPFGENESEAMACETTGRSSLFSPFYLWMNASVPGSVLRVHGSMVFRADRLLQNASYVVNYSGTLVDGWNTINFGGMNFHWGGSNALLFEGLATIVIVIGAVILFATFYRRRRPDTQGVA